MSSILRFGLIFGCCAGFLYRGTLSSTDELRFPVPHSEIIRGIEWFGPAIPYSEEGKRGDTFPMTWASDGEIYTSAGDPNWTIGDYPNKKNRDHGLDVERFSGHPPDYRIERINDMDKFVGGGGRGPKPTGMISVQDVLYFAAQNLTLEHRIAPRRHPDSLIPSTLEFGAIHLPSQRGSEAGIFRSADFGKTWSPARGETPMFRGHLFGGPAFINFGQDNEHARDDFVYAVSVDQWDNGSELRLGRVPKHRILDRTAWEWVGGFRDDKRSEPIWTSDLEKSVALLSCPRYLSLPDMVYVAGIKRYVLLTWHLNYDFNPYMGSQLVVCESPEPWGPFRLAHHESPWETNEVTPYCPRLPPKWLETDGVTGWLQFSGAWLPPENRPYYRSNVRRFRFILRTPNEAR